MSGAPIVEPPGELLPIEGGWLVEGDAVRVRHEAAGAVFYRHGWQSWSMVGLEPIADPPLRILADDLHRQADDPATEQEPGHVGSWVGAIVGADEAVLVGALGLDARVRADAMGLEGTSAEPIPWFVARGGLDQCLEAYARALGDHLGRRSPSDESLWCTWYSQGRDLDAPRVLQLIDEVAPLPADVFLVDDGWERGIGDWRPHSGFPDGMPAIAEAVARAGMRPGLWLAPLAVELDHADRWAGLLVSNPDGSPVLAGYNWNSRYFGVDVTHPEALDRVCEMARLAVEWGFTYLKLDFLFAGAIPGLRHGPGPREAAYRTAVEAIRATVGDDVHLAACGAPVVPSIGVFDSIRVGPDVAPYWESPLYPHVLDYSAPGMRRAIATSLGRLWLAGAIGVDPDVAFVRDTQNLLTPDEMAAHRDLCAITGMRGTSDPPGWLAESELEVLVEFLGGREPVERIGVHRFRVGDRVVDYTPVVEGAFRGL